jgi:hypothetical protein
MKKAEEKANPPPPRRGETLTLDVWGVRYRVHSYSRLPKKEISIEKDTPTRAAPLLAWAYLAISELDDKPYSIVIRVSYFGEDSAFLDDIPIEVRPGAIMGSHSFGPSVILASGRRLDFSLGDQALKVHIRLATLKESRLVSQEIERRQGEEEATPATAATPQAENWHDPMTIGEAALYCGCHEKTIRNRLRKLNSDGTPMIPGVIGTGRLTRIPRASLEPFRERPTATTKTSRKRPLRKSVKRRK